MLKKAALVFGVVLIIAGIAGFIPALSPTDSEGVKRVLGILEVNALHNLVHLLSGVAAIALSRSEAHASLYFKVFGVIYAIVTVVGFAQVHTVLGLIPVNLADNLLHVAISVSALYLGFGVKPQASRAA